MHATLNQISQVEEALKSAGVTDQVVQRVAEIRNELVNEPVRVAILGAFKAGKSTLCNALIGTELLPTKAIPNSATVAEVQRGPERFELATPNGVEVIDRERFVQETQRNAIKGAPPIVARAFLPGIVLAEGVILADTPGVGSFEEVHAEVSYAYLPKVDAIVLVIDAEKGGLHASDVAFVRDRLLQRVRDRLWVVVNRLNLKPESSHAEILADVAKSLREGAGLDQPRIFAVNALAAKEARCAGQSASATGIDQLEQALQTEVFARVRALRTQRARVQLREVLADAAAVLRTHAGALAFDDKTIAEQLTALRAEHGRLSQRVQTAEADLHRTQQQFLAEIDSRVRTEIGKIANRSGQFLSDVESHGSQRGELMLANTIQSEIMRALEALFCDWLEPELLERLRQFGKSIDASMTAFKAALPSIDLSGVRLGPNTMLVAGVEVGLNVLLNTILPGGWLVALFGRVVGKRALDPVVQQVAQYVSNLLGGVVRGSVAAQMASQINEVASVVSSEVQEQVRRAFGRAKESMREDLARRMSEIEGALEAARTEQRKGEQSVLAERDVLLGKVRRLDSISHELQVG